MKRLLVAAAVLVRDGKVLLSRRLSGAHLAGLWEFPGGKVEEGEGPREALMRELREELGVIAHVGDCLDVVHHVYAEAQREVVLLFFTCELAPDSPEPRELEVAELAWVGPDELPRYEFPPADLPLLTRVRELLYAAQATFH